MDQIKKDKLRAWFESLEQSKQIDIALECIQELILVDTIRYWGGKNAPYWDASGDRLDGSEYIDE